MKLFTFCQKCREETPVKSSAKTRSDLEQEKGLIFMVNCHHCGSMANYHVNDIKATVSGKMVIAGVFLGLIVTAILGIFMGGISILGMGVSILIWQSQEKAASHFNRYLLPRE